ncbi:alkaline phosphatase [Marinococcus halophilus]|uniref:alkaline phosphatase n=1 Tax=Marinococcus halophilus TaxID=1371 RepID=UPI00361AF4BD
MPSILDNAADMGKSTGLVATSTITHATPAVFASNVEDRNNYTVIAKQMARNENLDLMYAADVNTSCRNLKAASGRRRENYVDKAIDAALNM